MSEIIFLVEDAVEGGYTARALGVSIFTEAETLEGLLPKIRLVKEVYFNGNRICCCYF